MRYRINFEMLDDLRPVSTRCRRRAHDLCAGAMLTPAIHKTYEAGVRALAEHNRVETLAAVA